MFALVIVVHVTVILTTMTFREKRQKQSRDSFSINQSNLLSHVTPRCLVHNKIDVKE